MELYVICLNPQKAVKVNAFPLCVGRSPSGLCSVKIDAPEISSTQFVLKKLPFLEKYSFVDKSQANPGVLDDVPVEAGETREFSPLEPHLLQVGGIAIGFGADLNAVRDALRAAADDAEDMYCARVSGQELGPWTGEQLLDACENGVVGRKTPVWLVGNPEGAKPAGEWVDFGEEEMASEAVAAQTERRRSVSVDEARVELGENFLCPYCRTVSDLEDVLSVSVSPALLGDSVLGESEQARFLPSRFTGNGLAIDSEGGVCTEIACPRCHMSLPRKLLETPQLVLSVIGAAGAGKSVFLASSTWQCRQRLAGLFGVSFMDLDPVANRWINAYEEKLFFQEDDQTLQQIEKTDLQASNVSRSVMLDGESVLLPMPSFFSLRLKGGERDHGLVLYDSAGEHFRTGADTATSAVTLNMLNSDALFFMFDPSADPRFRDLLDRGSGTARNYAQRQDILLSEMVARIRRHLGNRSETRLSRPLIFGVSKADLLRHRLPLDAPIYSGGAPGGYALDVAVLREVSRKTEACLDEIVPEVVATAHEIATDVWFVPVSALGHNPMREGVRPCDIKPIWTELPVVFTLAKKGLIPTVGGSL